MTVDIRRSSSRFVEREPGRRTQHAFSFGARYDPEWLSFGPMVCHDDHLLGSGRGFEEHPHSDLEIVTYVVSGSLVHADSLGTSGSLRAGEVAVLSAGTGVRHSEVAATDGAARFVQVWLRPDQVGAAPGYARGSAAGAVEGAGLVPIAGVGSELAVGVAGASYAVARLAAGEKLILPAAARVHAYVVSGGLMRSSLAAPLDTGDAFCFVDEPGHQVTAAMPTELLVWSFGPSVAHPEPHRQ
ncbi:pirin family protein [Nocardioides bizhenqiangii]|uniref:Pirin family protein n=1 Tax=Nocardioides bizhenqiangii TaxID=3095076 RepID=A0ABZ0ZRC5_9ACTN|nr:MULTISPECIES: pirin family protein [unclassified Nocardioides]MDZ5619517.1 pirin family protein [Nocardioides sp. HM23]WQQ26466.1 pirin family protein [Nocardioides sp. HM61]